MAAIEDLEALGYVVGEASPGIYSVVGFGISVYANDQAAIDSLADPAAHAERVRQYENGPSEPTLTAAGPTPAESAIAALNPKTATVEDVVNALKKASL